MSLCAPKPEGGGLDRHRPDHPTARSPCFTSTAIRRFWPYARKRLRLNRRPRRRRVRASSPRSHRRRSRAPVGV